MRERGPYRLADVIEALDLEIEGKAPAGIWERLSRDFCKQLGLAYPDDQGGRQRGEGGDGG